MSLYFWGLRCRSSSTLTVMSLSCPTALRYVHSDELNLINMRFHDHGGSKLVREIVAPPPLPTRCRHKSGQLQGADCHSPKDQGGSRSHIQSSTHDRLRGFALCYERHPESMRTVPWLRPAGRDSVSAESADPRTNSKSIIFLRSICQKSAPDELQIES